MQNQNSATNSLGISGNAFAANVAVVNAGPTAASLGLIGTGAFAAQTGSNLVVLDQHSNAVTGDALAGSQVTGLVSPEWGNLRVQNQQSSDSAFAFSGNAVSANAALVGAGPTAVGAGLIGGIAAATQGGSNNVIMSQRANAESGDALAGSGVTGAVGGTGVIMNQNSSNLAVAASGNAVALNGAATLAGPTAISLVPLGLGTAQASQFGNNNVALGQEANSVSGDALAGSQVTGAVGSGAVTVQNQNSSNLSFAFSGNSVAANGSAVLAGPQAGAATLLGLANAQANQAGNNNVTLGQAANAQTGDAVSGTQVTGVVAGGPVTVQNQNNANLSFSLSGSSIATNGAFLAAGPSANAFAALLGSANAATSQFGNNTANVGQAASTSTGDAVSGSQVTGVVASGGAVRVQNQNSADLSFAFSGLAFGSNGLTANAGPQSQATAGAFGGNANAQASQVGNTRLVFGQDLSAATGDAVGGSQIAGVVGSGPGSAVQQQNNSDFALALSGLVQGFNNAGGALGAGAVAVVPMGATGTATTQQAGNASLVAGQNLGLTSGDAVVGGQVVGLVGGSATGATAGASVAGGIDAATAGEAGFFGMSSVGEIS